MVQPIRWVWKIMATDFRFQDVFPHFYVSFAGSFSPDSFSPDMDVCYCSLRSYWPLVHTFGIPLIRSTIWAVTLAHFDYCLMFVAVVRRSSSIGNYYWGEYITCFLLLAFQAEPKREVTMGKNYGRPMHCFWNRLFYFESYAILPNAKKRKKELK